MLRFSDLLLRRAADGDGGRQHRGGGRELLVDERVALPGQQQQVQERPQRHQQRLPRQDHLQADPGAQFSQRPSRGAEPPRGTHGQKEEDPHQRLSPRRSAHLPQHQKLPPH